MKNKIKNISFILAITVALIFMLTACAEPAVPEPSAEDMLKILTENFEENASYFITGNVARDGITASEVGGTINDSDKQILLDINDTRYIYSAKYLLQSGEKGFTVAKSNTSYNATLALVPFSMFDFKYNPNYRGDVVKADNHIIITFISGGVKNTFSSPLSVSGGVFSIAYSGKRVTETVLTTTLTENEKTIRYSAHYTYSEGGKAYDAVPWVAPTDTADYAAYAVSMLANSHKTDTLHVAGSDRDTGVMIGALITDPSKISNVFVIEAEKAFSLNIVFSGKQVIPGLSSNAEEIQIVYNSDYQVISVAVNKTNKYVLK